MTETAGIKSMRPIWFEPFLQQVKLELGYPVDIRKYGLLLNWANNNSWNSRDIPFEKLYAVCRVLFLQNFDHEPRFREIFKSYLVDELAFEQAEMQVNRQSETRTEASKTGATTSTETREIETTKAAHSVEELEKEPLDDSSPVTIPSKKYLNFTIPLTMDKATVTAASSGNSRFLLSDAYFPLTTREMIHGWRHLRKRERFQLSDRLDVPATVNHIAQQGILLEPVFEKEQVNSDDLLVIFADRRGSMTPFHKLTDKLIETAVKGGGHKRAMIYYFSNCPVGVVYKNPELTEPVALSQLYSQMRPDHTNALIISDAGAARGNDNYFRIEKTNEFLNGSKTDGVITEGLHKRALFVAWLNPMPQHRWVNSSAARIASDSNTPMYSLMDDGYNNFLHLIEKLMGK